MARIVLIIILTIMTSLTSLGAAENGHSGFGLGIILGEPTGLSGKLWTGGKTAVDGALAWSTDRDANLHLHIDYLVHNFNFINIDETYLPVYYGIGGRMKFSEHDNDDFIGVRVPVGVAQMFENAPVDLFFEIVPILDLAPDTDFDINIALGGRYFF